MDKTEVFIKMCEKAEEIQKGHVFVPGDYKSYSGLVSLIESCDSDRVYYHYPFRIWLPTQDQLQEMAFEHLKQKYPAYEQGKIVKYNYNTFDLLNSFTNFIVDFEHTVVHNEEYSLLETTSNERLWLMLVMKKLYNKTWNGKEWIKKEE